MLKKVIMSLPIVIKTNHVGEAMCKNWNDSAALIKAIVGNAITGRMPYRMT